MLVALALAVPLLFVSASPAFADRFVINDYAPVGTINVAKNSTAAVSDAYDATTGADKLVDGIPGNNTVLNTWATNNYSATTPGWATVTLASDVAVQRIALFPRAKDGYAQFFPAEFTVSLLDSSSVEVWKSQTFTISYSGQTFLAALTEPFVIDLPNPTVGRIVRLDVSKRLCSGANCGLQLGELAVFAEPPTISLADFAPTDGVNLAPEASVSASSNYADTPAGWGLANVNDEQYLGYRGWVTPPNETMTDPMSPAWLTYRWDCPVDIDRVVLVPRWSFPADYKLQVSDDGTTWTDVHTSTGNPQISSTDDPVVNVPVVVDLPTGTKGNFLRFYVTKRQLPNYPQTWGYQVGLSEMAAFGAYGMCIKQVKPALLLEPGMVESNAFEIMNASALTWASSDTAVATVDADGQITAEAVGEATVTLSDATSVLGSVPVEVRDEVEHVGKDFVVSVFWPGSDTYVNETQFGYMADAGVDHLEYVTDWYTTLDTPKREFSLKSALLADKFGMQVTVVDHDGCEQTSSNPWYGCEATSLTTAQFAKIAKSFQNVPGVGGIYLRDEPPNAVALAPAFNTIRQTTPELQPHLNFFPYYYYGGAAQYRAAATDWLNATGGVRSDIYAPDYLTYDLYALNTTNTNMERMLVNMDLNREIGLEYNIKTGAYINTLSHGSYRTPTASDLAYQANAMMAMGYKRIEYFTWMTPTNPTENFGDGVVTGNGVKTALFPMVKQVNAEVHALGPVLMKLDAKEVYFNGAQYNVAGKTVPAGFFVHSKRTDDNVILSYLRDRDNDRNYLFVVNNNNLGTGAQPSVTVDLEFNPAISSLQEVSRTDGSLSTVALTGQVLSRTLAGGEGVLYALPEGYDYEDDVAPAAPVITSPVADATVTKTTPTLTGTAEPFSTVTLATGGVTLGTTTADVDGSWAFTPTSPLAEGSVTVEVTATDRSGNTSPAASVTFTVSVAPVVLSVSQPVLSGVARVGGTLSVAMTVAPSDAQVVYQWFRGTSFLSQASGASYVVQSADAGADIKVKVIASRDGSASVTKYSNTLAIADQIKVTRKLLPASATVGESVSLDLAYTPVDAGVSVQWFRGTSLIAGASGTEYVLTAADSGGSVVAKVTLAKDGFDSVTVYSSTVAVSGPVAPSVKLATLSPAGTVEAGQALDLNLTVVPENATVKVEWFTGTSLFRVNGQPVTGKSYTPSVGDVGKDLVVKVTVTVDGFTPIVKYTNRVIITPPANL
jgi:hypothetical protein